MSIDTRFPVGTCQRCGSSIGIGPGAQPNVSCVSCGAPSVLVLGDQRLFISPDSKYPVEWKHVEQALNEHGILYWKRFDPECNAGRSAHGIET